MYPWIVQSIKFLIVGFVNSTFGLAIIFGLIYWGRMEPLWANVIGYAVGLSIGFLLNRSWTFKSTKSTYSQIVRYFFAFVCSFGLNLAVLECLRRSSDLNIYLIQIISVASYSVAMFFICRFYVFSTKTQAKKRGTVQ